MVTNQVGIPNIIAPQIFFEGGFTNHLPNILATFLEIES